MKLSDVHIFILLLLILLIQPGCRRSGSEPALFTTRSTESIIVDYLATVYEQPVNNSWKDDKAYFLPEKPGLELLRHEADLHDLSVYRASVWVAHWAPEEFPVLVWVVRKQGELQLGLSEGREEIAERFPGALEGVLFKDPKLRRDFALLLGEMVNVLESGHSTGGTLATVSKGDCEWAEWVGASQGKTHRIAAACFSDEGVREQIILPSRSER